MSTPKIAATPDTPVIDNQSSSTVAPGYSMRPDLEIQFPVKVIPGPSLVEATGRDVFESWRTAEDLQFIAHAVNHHFELRDALWDLWREREQRAWSLPVEVDARVRAVLAQAGGAASRFNASPEDQTSEQPVESPAIGVEARAALREANGGTP